MFEPKRRPIDFPGNGVVDHPAAEATDAIRTGAAETYDAFRAGCYGEALLAFSRYLQEDILSPPSREMLAMLGQAYDRISGEFDAFTREDYALYAMSMLHRQPGAENSDHEDLRRGAARYLLDVKTRLSPHFQGLSDDAQSFLAEMPADGVTEERPAETIALLGTSLDPHPAPAWESGNEQIEAFLPALPKRGPKERDIPYRRLDLAGANRPVSASTEQIHHAPQRQGRPLKRAGTQKSYGALAILFAAIVSGTTLITYIALSLLFAD